MRTINLAYGLIYCYRCTYGLKILKMIFVNNLTLYIFTFQIPLTMNKFITGKKLESAVYDIIWQAEKTLLIVSPYIRLDYYFKELFDHHQNNPEVHIVLVFGKNETAVNRSLSKNDFDYFKKFPNISIIYVSNLHAKYYGNERKGVITSINLHDHSFKNNIEFGIYSERTVINQLIRDTDEDAWNECLDIAHNNDVVFVKRPIFESKKFIINIGKHYIKSDILYDSTEHFYGNASIKYKSKKLDDFPEIIESEAGYRPEREEIKENNKQKTGTKKEVTKNYLNAEEPQQGYCIRTGEPIPFNPSYPLSRYAWKTWNEFANPDYPEKYCHKTGKPSYGKTSFRYPIL